MLQRKTQPAFPTPLPLLRSGVSRYRSVDSSQQNHFRNFQNINHKRLKSAPDLGGSVNVAVDRVSAATGRKGKAPFATSSSAIRRASSGAACRAPPPPVATSGATS